MNEQLYFLGGMFQDSAWGHGGFPFAGYLKKFDMRTIAIPPSLPFEKPVQYNIQGQLIDQFGASEISGILEQESLVFTKDYPREGNKYIYEFQNKEGLWKGKMEKY